MRMIMKVEFGLEAGNKAIRDGSMGETIQSILAEQKPEAVYFMASNGNHTGIIILDMQDPSEIPALTEPWFLAFDAKIEIQPVMVPEDFMKAGPAIEQVVKKYG